MNEPPDEPLRTAEPRRRSSNVQQWSAVGCGGRRSITAPDRWVVSPTGHGVTPGSYLHLQPYDQRTARSGPSGPIDDGQDKMKRVSRRVIPVAVVGLVLMVDVIGSTFASAGEPHESVVDQVARRYEIPVTNPVDHVDLPAVLLVKSATLATLNPDGSGTTAPTGKIYLTVQATCGPIQSNFGQPDWGHFYSNLAPLPAAALRYVTAAGRSYAASRVNPVGQARNIYATSNDGLLDAIYYFTVPITNRAGTLVIEPSRDVGVPYTGFVGGSPVPLVVGGPTRVALRFPKRLTVVTTPNSIPPVGPNTPGARYASTLNLASTLLGLVMVGLGYLALKRRRRRQIQPQFMIHNLLAPNPPSSSHENPVPESASPAPTAPTRPPPGTPPGTPISRRESELAPSTLRVNVLGPLELTPTFAPPIDPVRAILAFLALSDRPLTLEEIQNAVWPLSENGTDIKRPAMRNYMVEARKVVGRGHLPVAAGAPGYRLVNVDTDWAEFTRLVAQAKTADAPTALGLRREALALVRDVPFAADTSRYFSWAFTTSVVYAIVDAVTTLAHELATALVLGGDLPGAEAALRQGLICDPASLTLWEDLTDVLLETADPSLLEVHWRSAGLVLRADDVVALRTRERG